jgi:D-glycero-D-manno-heptose 1,7-bisphosphate phosphatase
MSTDKIKLPAVFLDRDGTLIEEVNFLHRVEDLRFFDYTDAAVRLLKENGYLVVIVTNQSGIGRGVYDEAAMHGIHEKIQADLTVKLDAFYFCPHLPNEGCICRKPNLGMIENAMRDFEIDLEKSWMIGDKQIDIQAGHNAGMRTALVLTGYGAGEVDKLLEKPDIVAETLLEAVKDIIATR